MFNDCPTLHSIDYNDKTQGIDNALQILIKELEKKLEASGIILRERNSYGIKNCLRLTIGNNHENKLLLDNLKNIFKNV